MFQPLKDFCQEALDFTADELALIDTYFEGKYLKKKAFFIREGRVCTYLAFISKGCFRHFHLKDGDEKTCDITFERDWITDFQSFTNQAIGKMNIQALEDAYLIAISREKLYELYNVCPKYETLGRLMTERIVHKSTQMAMSLASEKPEERFLRLIERQPNILQKVPQKHIANLIGISPESLSRLRKRISAD